MNKEDNGLYIHIPFCASKCGYCDFLSYDDKQKVQAAYKDALIRELSHCTSFVDTIYIGGGTPTIWPAPFLSELLNALPHASEITCEANPGTLTMPKISALAKGGVSRISLGLQAWQPHLLKAIGRRSSTTAFLKNFHALRSAGFNNINVDIMFALPGQSLADWEETLKNVAVLEPEHISAYALTPTDMDEETDRLMYHNCKAFLRKRGYKQYELSNFCKPGFECKHNLRYWTCRPYTGYGLGAHSFDGKMRWNNTTDLEKYINIFHSKPHATAAHRDKCKSYLYSKDSSENIIKAETKLEFMIMGLRMTEGVLLNDDLWEAYSLWITKMINDGLLEKRQEENGRRIALTDRGMDLANLVMAGFLE